LDQSRQVIRAGLEDDFMGIPGGDDVMLMYQSSSYHDIAALREITHKKVIKEFEVRMEELGILREGRLTNIAGDGLSSMSINANLRDTYSIICDGLKEKGYTIGTPPVEAGAQIVNLVEIMMKEKKSGVDLKF
jgi:hypothetical protein